MKILSQTGLTELITKIKAWGNATFLKKSETETTSVISIDTAPTASSTNLITSGGVKTALDAKEDTLNKVTSISSTSTDAQYPSAKCVYDTIGDIESLLAAI